jgi:pimeloyl-ACP methyl ester carboxylesterase
LSGASNVSADGLSIRALKSGITSASDKPIVVLFHGFSFSLDDWLRIGTIDILSSRGYGCIALDLPKGKASKSDKVTKKDVFEYAPIIEKVLRELLGPNGGLTQGLIIVGPSMGGSFALAYAIRNPEKVRGLVLIAPSTKDIPEEALRELDTPILLVWGENDNIFPVSAHAGDLKGAGHAAYLDKTSEFHELLLDFLDEVSS